jgi:hypothetical protein
MAVAAMLSGMRAGERGQQQPGGAGAPQDPQVVEFHHRPVPRSCAMLVCLA